MDRIGSRVPIHFDNCTIGN